MADWKSERAVTLHVMPEGGIGQRLRETVSGPVFAVCPKQ